VIVGFAFEQIQKQFQRESRMAIAKQKTNARKGYPDQHIRAKNIASRNSQW